MAVAGGLAHRQHLSQERRFRRGAIAIFTAIFTVAAAAAFSASSLCSFSISRRSPCGHSLVIAGAEATEATEALKVVVVLLESPLDRLCLLPSLIAVASSAASSIVGATESFPPVDRELLGAPVTRR